MPHWLNEPEKKIQSNIQEHFVFLIHVAGIIICILYSGWQYCDISDILKINSIIW